jgi:3-oxoacyl-(acyl-carrier-protein) synthase
MPAQRGGEVNQRGIADRMAVPVIDGLEAIGRSSRNRPTSPSGRCRPTDRRRAGIRDGSGAA